ncbi:MAG: type II toxin-antitoxin system VapB family antitoxin [Verrucomicrobiota bacterium]
MPTNLKIDESLLDEARSLGGFPTKKETVNTALAEFIQHRKQLELLKLENAVDFFEDYDPKQLRNSR